MLSVIKKILPEITAFLIGISTVYFLNWDTTDLVWSLWLSSLTLGYTTILSAVAGGAYFGLHVIFHEDFPRSHRLPAIISGGFFLLFLLGFFSFHFCAFHSGHASFLISFFPVAGIPESSFMDSFMNPPLLWKTVFRYIMPLYGVFLVATLITERLNIFAPLVDAVRLVNQGIKKETAQTYPQSSDTKKRALKDPFTRPYINVIKMHLLIFFFAGCHALKVDSFVVYAAVYMVYFFPWRILKQGKESEKLRRNALN